MKSISNDMTASEVADTLIAVRTKLGITQGALGEFCGVSSNQISKYEKGWTMPRQSSIDTLNAGLSAAYDRHLRVIPAAKVVASKTSHINGTATGRFGVVESLQSFSVEDMSKELKRRGFSVNLTMSE